MTIIIKENSFTTKDNKTIVCYNITSRKPIHINLPIANMAEAIEYIDSIEPDEYDRKKLGNKKFEIYITKKDASKFNEVLLEFKKEKNIVGDIKLAYGNYKDISNNDLYKTKIVFNPFEMYCWGSINRKNIMLKINAIKIYKINENYFANLVIKRITGEIVSNLDQYSISPYSAASNYRPALYDEISKIKTEYKTYITALKKKIKSQNITVNI